MSRSVAISQRVDFYRERGEYRDALDQRWAEWCAALDLLPVPIPNCLRGDSLQHWLGSLKPDGILLSGGNDWGECAERDQTELSLLDWAESSSAPVLGICRGFQVLCIRAGVDPISVPNHIGRHQLRRDSVPAMAGRNVNSFHHLGVLQCPDGYHALARADDGVLEAMSHQSLPWEAWMWHPERESQFVAEDLSRAARLFGGRSQ